jgi:hypothetical protein
MLITAGVRATIPNASISSRPAVGLANGFHTAASYRRACDRSRVPPV